MGAAKKYFKERKKKKKRHWPSQGITWSGLGSFAKREKSCGSRSHVPSSQCLGSKKATLPSGMETEKSWERLRFRGGFNREPLSCASRSLVRGGKGGLGSPPPDHTTVMNGESGPGAGLLTPAHLPPPKTYPRYQLPLDRETEAWRDVAISQSCRLQGCRPHLWVLGFLRSFSYFSKIFICFYLFIYLFF